MERNLVGWFDIYVDDMERAKSFYESVFQIKLEKLENLPASDQEMEMHVFPGDHTKCGATGALVRMAGCESGKNSVLVYFSCADCSVEEKRAADSGGQVMKSKFSIGEHGFVSLVCDTEGNMIGLHSLQ